MRIWLKNNPGSCCHKLAGCSPERNLCRVAGGTSSSYPPWPAARGCLCSLKASARGEKASSWLRPSLGWAQPPTPHPRRRMRMGRSWGMSTVWVSRQESAGSGAGDARGAPEALPKDRAVNCYLSNQAVSRLPGVKQRWWKVSCCQSEKWHRRGPFLLGSFCWECE